MSLNILIEETEKLLSKIKFTRYSHDNFVDIQKGIYELDCSGFVSLILKETFPQLLNIIPVKTGNIYPHASEFYDYFNSIKKSDNNWDIRNSFTYIEPGDFIVWKKVSIERQKLILKNDTGHIMIVNKIISTSNSQMNIEVYDSSIARHFQDSRPDNQTGIGKGIIRFKIDTAMKPLSFQFNSSTGFHTYPILIGKIKSV